ncbi:retinol dehydrogenase 12 [Anopheles darlingi]|uniref:retinol dehydrogenase 12 n=1 Tax=Anopheles darlingi TaxID=43151 RepID=UPI0021006264|nr:retinol dehydrogenase 12 [Anopheles darlingi]XP_049538656.1 retinol dehydrogenase 12 [Anopheles darlingi]
MALLEEIKGALGEADPFATWWPFIIAAIVFVIGTVRAYMGGQPCPNGNAIPGRLVVVTGASGGIGSAVCRELARRNAQLVLACRGNPDQQQHLRAELIRAGATDVEVLALDLASLDSVRRFARQLLARHPAIDVLVNCAGVIFHPPGPTVDGFEPHLQCNFLAHLLLTQLLLPALARSPHGPPGRIVNVVAHGYTAGRIAHPTDDPLNQRHQPPASGRDAFSHSKLAIVLASRALAKRLPPTTTINCCTPGLVRGTGHLRHSPIMRALFARILTYPWMWLFMKSPAQGAQTIVRLVTDPELNGHTGGLYNDCEPVELTDLAKDEQLAERLYRAALEAVGLSEGLEEEEQNTTP